QEEPLMSSVIETRPDIMWLSPSWQLADQDPAIRIEPNGFTLNNAAQERVKQPGTPVSKIVVGVSRDGNELFLTRVVVADYPRSVSADPAHFFHWELGKMLEQGGYTTGSILTFGETEDPDMIAAYLTKRGQ